MSLNKPVNKKVIKNSDECVDWKKAYVKRTQIVLLISLILIPMFYLLYSSDEGKVRVVLDLDSNEVDLSENPIYVVSHTTGDKYMFTDINGTLMLDSVSCYYSIGDISDIFGTDVNFALIQSNRIEESSQLEGLVTKLFSLKQTAISYYAFKIPESGKVDFTRTLSDTYSYSLIINAFVLPNAEADPATDGEIFPIRFIFKFDTVSSLTDVDKNTVLDGKKLQKLTIEVTSMDVDTQGSKDFVDFCTEDNNTIPETYPFIAKGEYGYNYELW